MANSPRVTAGGRRRARRAAMQALYQWQSTAQGTLTIESQFLEDDGLKKADIPYFQDIFTNLPEKLGELDPLLEACLDRSVAQLNPVERAILRVASYELRFRRDVPWRVVINEAVELAKDFGAAGAHKYVNGVLDKLHHDLEQNTDKSD